MWSRVIFSISGKLAKLDVFSLSIELNDIEIDLSLIKVISNRFGTSWNLLLSQKLSPKVSNCIKIETKKIENFKNSKPAKYFKNSFQGSNAYQEYCFDPARMKMGAILTFFDFWRKSDFFLFFDIYGAIFKFDLSALNAKMSMIERPFWKLNSANWNSFKKYTWTMCLVYVFLYHNADVSKNVFVNVNFM